MPNLPTGDDFTNSSVTEAEFKTAITNLRNFLADLLGTDGTQSNALDAIGALSGNMQSKNSNYTVIANDRGDIFKCISTLELALTSASVLGASFSFIVSNTGTGTVTINPNGTETIDGQPTKTVGAGQSLIIYCDGLNFYSIAGGGGGFNGLQVFTTDGVFTVPSGISKIKVTAFGAGGGGGGGLTNSYLSGSGGGQGGIATKAITGLVSGDTILVTVGVGGSGGATGASPNGGDGTGGGTTSFGGYVSATGGGGGQGARNGSFSFAGIGGEGAGGDVNLKGIDGFSSSGSSLAGGGGVGGGSAVQYGTGNAGKLGGGGGGGGVYPSAGIGGVGGNGYVVIEY